MKLKRKYKIALICIPFAILLIYSFYHILLWIINNNDIKKELTKINNEIIIDEIEDDNEDLYVNPPEDENDPYWKFIKYSLIDVNINDLKEVNKDTIGWIQINNTNINYPYVQSKDNSYYLNHSFEHKYTDAGWIFLDYRNSTGEFDRNNILYGHSRLNQTMFGTLKEVLRNSWFKNKDNHIIKITTENDKTLWQIFSVYTSDDDYHIKVNLDNDGAFLLFIDKIKEQSIYNFDTNIDINDKILTLSTCLNDREKIVVHAKLIKRA